MNAHCEHMAKAAGCNMCTILRMSSNSKPRSEKFETHSLHHVVSHQMLHFYICILTRTHGLSIPIQLPQRFLVTWCFSPYYSRRVLQYVAWWLRLLNIVSRSRCFWAPWPWLWTNPSGYCISAPALKKRQSHRLIIWPVIDRGNNSGSCLLVFKFHYCTYARRANMRRLLSGCASMRRTHVQYNNVTRTAAAIRAGYSRSCSNLMHYLFT